MLDQFIYEDHNGRRFVGLDNGVYLNYSDLRDYSWSYDTINSRISRFYRPITSRKIPLVVYCDTEEKAIAIKNRLYELTETDVVANMPGKIYVGEYYTCGYITASVKGEYLINKRLCKIDLTFVSSDPSWYRETKYSFFPENDNEISVGGGTDYPYDYPYDYAVAMTGRTITCNSIGTNAFRLQIYGEITNPAIMIGNHTYAINGAVASGETLVVDSVNKTIVHSTNAGVKTNWFDKRARENYIFEPIPSGENTISWAGDFGFDLTVIEKRSEPKWI